jgi:hypothetical protein
VTAERSNFMKNQHCASRTARILLRAIPSLAALTIAMAAHAQPVITITKTAVPLDILTQQTDADAIQMRVDGGKLQPMLNVVADGGEKQLVQIGSPVSFHSYWNYGAFIKSGEVRIFRAAQSMDQTPINVIPLDADGKAAFTPSASDPEAVFYVLRVYGADGAFDETRPAELVIAKAAPATTTPANPSTLFGTDNSARRNIKMRGGTVTVTGQNPGAQSTLIVAGQRVPVASDGRFVAQQILPFGKQDVAVHTVGPDGSPISFVQEVNIRKNEWFTVAIGDVTLGSNAAKGPAALVTGNDEEFDKLYLNTRGAFYTKGRIGERTRVTASVDTGEATLSSLFSNLNDKDPQQLLRRLDSTLYYPSYGDDSSTVEDAPTQGRFYLRVDHDDSKLVLGNYVLDASGTELAQLDRGLYGALGDYVSNGVTSFGERRTRITGFASDPGTAPAREEFRGTGGSAYFLQRQDLSIGSERLRVEIRDKDSGLVLETRELRPQEDYDIDYIQGRVLLTRPLSSTAYDGQTVRTGSQAGHLAILVVRYEYTPTISDLGGYTFGARATHWFGDVVRLGATGQREATGNADQTLLGADIVIRKSADSFLKAEVARTSGPSFGQANSVDGGLNFATITNPGSRNVDALSWRAEGALAFKDVIGQPESKDDHGTLTAYYEHLDAGFSGAGRLSSDAVDRWGAKLALPVAKATKITADYDEVRGMVLGGGRSIDLGLEQGVGPLNAKLAFRHERRETNNVLTHIVDSGVRNDLALQLGYDAPAGWGLFGFAQTTLSRDVTRRGNSRAGVGGRYELNDRMSFNAEVSEGEGGVGANIGLTRRVGVNAETYLNYAISTDRADSGFEAQSLLTRSNFGTLTVGGKATVGENLSLRGEERMGFGTQTREMVHSYGFEYTPGSRWTMTGSLENGRINDQLTGSFDRTAATASLGYSSEGVRMASSLEARFEEGVGRNQTSWLSRSTIGIDANPSWRLLGRLNFAVSDADQGDILDAGFVEGVVGFAYRPVDNNRMNALVKYTYFRDTSTFGQITAGGTTAAPKQRSQIFSADVTYKLTNWLSIGGKYGYRFGEVALSRTSSSFAKSTAHLGIIRADLQLNKAWDALIEARRLSVPTAGDERSGLLLGLYRNFGDNVKIGGGYSFADFSDNLTHLEYHSKGWFFNIIGKY